MGVLIKRIENILALYKIHSGNEVQSTHRQQIKKAPEAQASTSDVTGTPTLTAAP